MVLVWPNISALALLYVIGAYAIVLGIIAIGGAFWLPIGGGDTALMILSGLVSILFGIVMFAKPGAGALVTLALIAAFALITGITELVVAIGGKRLVEQNLEARGCAQAEATAVELTPKRRGGGFLARATRLPAAPCFLEVSAGRTTSPVRRSLRVRRR